MQATSERSRWLLPEPLPTSLLWAAQFLPSLPMYLGVASSMALGTLTAALWVLFICIVNDLLTTGRFVARAILVGRRALIGAVGAASFALAHALIAGLTQEMELAKFALSLASLLVIVAGAVALGGALHSLPPEKIDKMLKSSFIIFSCVILLHLLGLQPRPGTFEKSTFPFTEVSHFSLAFAPVWLYRCVRASPSRRPWWLAGGFAIALLMQSVTFMAASVLATMACRRFLLLSSIVAGSLIAALPMLDLSYFTSRLDFSGEVLNLSNLVYLQGWQMLIESFERSSGWGIGFQQLGLHGTNVSTAALVAALTNGVGLNVTDGSFILGKFGSEFGILGVLLIIAYSWFAFRCLKAMRRDRSSPFITFCRCVVVAYGIDMFFRGAGYFTQSTFVFLVAVSALLMNNPESRNRGSVRAASSYAH